MDCDGDVIGVGGCGVGGVGDRAVVRVPSLGRARLASWIRIRYLADKGVKSPFRVSCTLLPGGEEASAKQLSLYLFCPRNKGFPPKMSPCDPMADAAVEHALLAARAVLELQFLQLPGFCSSSL